MLEMKYFTQSKETGKQTKKRKKMRMDDKTMNK